MDVVFFGRTYFKFDLLSSTGQRLSRGCSRGCLSVAVAGESMGVSKQSRMVD